MDTNEYKCLFIHKVSTVVNHSSTEIFLASFLGSYMPMAQWLVHLFLTAATRGQILILLISTLYPQAVIDYFLWTLDVLNVLYCYPSVHCALVT